MKNICERLFKFHQDCPFLITYTSGSNWHICSSFCIIIYRFVCQFSLHYYWYSYNQRQSSPCCSARKVFLQISQDSQENTHKKRFIHRFFLMNSAKFLITSHLKNLSDGCFCKNTPSLYCRITTFRLFKNNITHISWLSIFSA